MNPNLHVAIHVAEPSAYNSWTMQSPYSDESVESELERYSND